MHFKQYDSIAWWVQTSKSLIAILAEKPDCGGLSNDLQKIKEIAAELLKRIIETFPEYTMPDIGHSERILEILEHILPEDLKNELNGHELFFLASASYCHDIGMINFPSLPIPENLKKDAKSIASYIRENHHTRSEAYITSNFKDLRIDDNHQASIIARIARGHRKEDLHDTKLFEPNRVYKGSAINVQLLTALIRLGDTLDITFERAPIVVYEHLPLKDPLSMDEWKKHLSISGVVRLPDDPLTIKSDAICYSPKIHRLLRKIEKDTNDQLDNLPDFLHYYRQFSKDLPRKFCLEITTEGYQAYDFRFSLEESQITDLLKGYALYKSHDESIRELLKNAVDACRSRMEQFEKTKSRQSYSPIIMIEEFSDGKLSIQDNGIGMNVDRIERYFTKLGRSFYNSPEFSENYTFTPLSELGIGFLSSFMVADKIVVETKTKVDPPIIMEIEDIPDFFTVRKGKAEEPGTCIKLFLKKGVNISFEDVLKRYAQHIEFPIEFSKFDRKGIVKITDKGFKHKHFARNSNLYTITIKEHFLEGIIDFLKVYDPFSVDLFDRLDLVDFGLNPFDENDKMIVSNEGIFVGYINLLPRWLNSGFFSYDLNLKKRIVDLNIARNDVIRDSEKFIAFANYIENLFVSNFDKFLSESEATAASTHSDFLPISNGLLHNYIVLERMEITAKLPRNLIHLLSKYAYIKCFSKEGLVCVRASEIIKNKKQVIPLFNLDEYSNVDIKRIMSVSPNFSEDNVYPSMGLSTYRLLSAIFQNYQSFDFLSFFEYTASNELSDIIPETWRLFKLKNNFSKRMIEFSHGEVTIINKDNPFLDLLIRHKNIINRTQKLALSRFFETLKLELKRNFLAVEDQHQEILTWFVDLKIIERQDMIKYILCKDDFPTHLL